MSSLAPLIVHVVYRFSVGGLENGVVNLINHLPRDQWRHAVVSLSDIDPGFASRLEDPAVELVAIRKQAGHGWRLYPQFVKLFRTLRPAIVHTRNLAALEVTPAAWAAGVPSRLHGEHGRDAIDPDGRNRRRQWVRRLYRPFVTRYVALSPDLESYLRDAIGVPGDRIEQIYNGVDCETFKPVGARGEIPGCPFREAHHRIVGTVGRLDPVKDHVGLVQAFAQVVRGHPTLTETLRLVIAGEGSERARIERTIDQLAIRDLVWLAGERRDIPTVLRGLDLFVLPSMGEGVSNTILEAMATALPVVASNVGANAELVLDGVTGSIVSAGDLGAIATRITRYSTDASLCSVHGRAGRLRVEQRFSLERMVERYNSVYLDLAKRSAFSRHRAETITRHAPH